jgi:hypothetical protein
MPAGYDNWKTASPFDGSDEILSDCCGAECLGDSEDYICAECREHCSSDEITAEMIGDAQYDAMRDDALTGD